MPNQSVKALKAKALKASYHEVVVKTSYKTVGSCHFGILNEIG